MLDAGLPVPAYFTTRSGGRSRHPYDSMNLGLHVGDNSADVESNRAELRRKLDAPVAYMAQQHGRAVAVVDDADSRPEADALITLTPGLAVAVLVADCVPVLVHDASTGAVAAIHAGRAGLELGIVGATIKALRQLGGSPESMSAAIGPAVCGECYEVPEQMQTEVAQAVPESASTTSWGTPALDLCAGVAAQLARAHVGAIRRSEGCTRESSDLFSHRRDGVTGRGCGVIVCAAR